jgi:hypothetical protein
MSGRLRAHNAEARKLISFAEDNGYEVSYTGGQSLKFKHKKTGAVTFAAATPRNRSYITAYRMLRNGLGRRTPEHKRVRRS